MEDTSLQFKLINTLEEAYAPMEDTSSCMGVLLAVVAIK